jgi:hypothetical protein
MCHAWKSSPPPEEPLPMGWLQDLLREVRAALATLATLVIVVSIAASLNLPPVTGECPGGGSQPRVVAVLRGDAGKMPESRAVRGGGGPAGSPLTWPNVVGRDGIEPPTLRFSAARSTD